MARHQTIVAVLSSLTAVLGIMLAPGCGQGGGTEGTWGRSFSGIIVADNGQPQSNVAVELLETGDRGITDSRGIFMLDRVELPVVPVTFQITGSQVQASVILSEELPKQEARVDLSIKVKSENAAEIAQVIVSVATPTPRPTATRTPVPPTPTSSAVSPAPTASPTTAPSSPQATPSAAPTPTATPMPTATPVECVGDLDGDLVVGLSDLSILLSAFGTSVGDPNYNAAADLSHNGTVDLVDQNLLLAQFGTDCR